MKRKLAFLLLSCIFLLTGCSSSEEVTTTEESTTANIMTTASQETTVETTQTTTQTTTQVVEVTDSEEVVATLINTGTQSFYSSDIFSDRDYVTSYDEADCYTITLSDSGITSSDSSAVISGSTITITQDADYIVTGSLSNGQIVIEAGEEDKVQLILNSVSITNSSSACINVVTGDKVFITTATDTTNTLTSTIVQSTSTTTTDTTNIDAVIFSKSDITLNGAGTLIINSTNGNGITSKDDLIITSGTYEVTTDMHGLEANDILGIAGGTFTITTGGGIANASTTSTSSSSNSRNTFSIFDIFSGYTDDETDDSYGKAIKCDTAIYILDGTFYIDSLDDAIHSDSITHIGGGTFEIQTGDDAIHANLETSISGGIIEIISCYEAIEGQRINISDGYIDMYCLDDGINAAISDSSLGDDDLYINISGGIIMMDTNQEGDGLDSNGDIYVSGGQILISSTTVTTDTALDYDGDGTITGGTFVGTQSDSITMQNFDSNSTQGSILVETSSTQTGTVKLTDSSGNVIIEIEPAKEYDAVIISSAEIVQGETYYLTAGNESYTVYMDSLIYGEGSSSQSSSPFSQNGR